MLHSRYLIIKDLFITPAVRGFLRAFSFLLLLAFLGVSGTQAQLRVTSFNTAYTQDFDSLGPAPAFTTKDTIPSWWGFRVAAGVLGTQDWNLAGDTTSRAAGTTGAGILSGTSSGGIFNFGNGVNATATDRALGFLHTTRFVAPSFIILRIDNNSGAPIRSLYLSFDYEKYRSGRRDWFWRLVHGSTPNPVSDTAASGYQFYPADTTNFNVFNPPQSVTKSVFLPNLNIPVNGSYYFKWVLTGSGGSSNGQGLAIDNFCLTAFSTPGISCTSPASPAVFNSLGGTTTTATVQFTPPATTSSIVIASTTLNPIPVPVNGLNYAADTVYGAGARIGNGFVVYNGTGSSVNVVNLNPGTRYYFYVYSYNLVTFGSPCSPSSLPCYNTTVALPTRYLDSITTTSASVDMRSWRFRSKGSGAWSAVSIWEAFNPSSSLWENANTAPSDNSQEINIQSGHVVDISSQVSMDSVLVNGTLRLLSTGVMNLKNGTAEFDMRIRNGGALRVVSDSAYSVAVINTPGSRIDVADSGRIAIGEGGNVGANYGSFGFISGFVNWNHNSIFEWNNTRSITASGTEYFPDTTAGVVPIFRITRIATSIQGGSNPTSIYGLLQANSAVTFGGAGVKVFRDGIVNTQTITKEPLSGQFQITGDEAVLGGTGQITVTSLDTGMLFSARRTTMKANKTILSRIFITGTFDSDTFTINGSSTRTRVEITGLFQTRNPRGFHGANNTSIHNNIPGIYINFPINPLTGLRGTVDYIGDRPQTITSIANGGNPRPYGNLSSTGSGSRTYVKTPRIQIEGDFNPGTASYVADSTTIEFMRPRTGNDTIQTIPGFNYYNLLISGTATKVTGGSSSVPVTVMDSLKLSANSRLDLASDLVLRSTATGTARLGLLETGSSITYSGGFFIVERFIKAGRNWQLLSAPIAPSGSQTIKEAWMEGAGSITSNPRPGFGTVITDSRSTWQTLGFDGQSPGGPSVKRYNSSTQTYDNVASTGDAISDDYGYFLFVRGDRTCLPTNVNQAATVLRMKGRLWGASKAVTVADSGWTCVGNPFASAIDFMKVRLSTSSTPVTNYYLWDPQAAGGYGVGSFIAFSYDQTLRKYDAAPNGSSFGAVNSRIESGQAFFIRLPDQNAGRQLRFLDSCKVAGSNNFFRPGLSGVADQLRINLKYSRDSLEEPVMMDGCLLSFSEINSDSVDEYDAIKFLNMSENLAISKGNVLLAIERRRSFTITDTVKLHIGPYRYSRYILEVDGSSWQLGNNMRAYLFDTYKSTYTALPAGEVTTCLLSTDADPASRSARRFMIVFTRPGRSSTAPNSPIVSNSANVSPQQNKTEINNSSLNIFPNPVGEDHFYVDSKKAGTGLMLAVIFNSSGQRVQSLPVSFFNSRGMVRLRKSLQPGTYRLVLLSADGDKFEFGHFVAK